MPTLGFIYLIGGVVVMFPDQIWRWFRVKTQFRSSGWVVSTSIRFVSLWKHCLVGLQSCMLSVLFTWLEVFLYCLLITFGGACAENSIRMGSGDICLASYFSMQVSWWS